MNGPVGWVGLAVSLLLVAVAAGISRWQHLGLGRQILIAAARALARSPVHPANHPGRQTPDSPLIR